MDILKYAEEYCKMASHYDRTIGKLDIDKIREGFELLKGTKHKTRQSALDAIDSIINPLDLFRSNYEKGKIGFINPDTGDVDIAKNISYSLNGVRIGDAVEINPELKVSFVPEKKFTKKPRPSWLGSELNKNKFTMDPDRF